MTTKTRPKPRPTLANITDAQREHLELCAHEAGHAVAGVVLGARLREAVVVQSKMLGTQAFTNFEPDMPSGSDVQAAYAGPWAQARFRAGRRPTAREMSTLWASCGRGDRTMLSLAGGTHLGASVTPLLERTWPAVQRVAMLLHEHREIHHKDVLAALGITDGGGRTSAQLNSLRLPGGWGRQVPPLDVPA